MNQAVAPLGTTPAPEEPACRSLALRVVDAVLPAGILQGDSDSLRRGRTLAGFFYGFALQAFGCMLVSRWILPPEANDSVLSGTFLAVAIAAGVPLALQRGALLIAANLLLAAAYVEIVGLFVLNGGMQVSVLNWCALLPMLALLMGGRRQAICWMIVCLATVAGLTATEMLSLRLANPPGLHGGTPWIQRFVDAGAWIGMLTVVAVLYERKNQRQAEHLGARNDELRREVTQRRQAEEKNRFLAYYDHLTRLPNRQFFKEQLRDAVDQAGVEGRQVGVLFLDLDGFKEINDTHGHNLGDLLLQHVARRLANCVRAADSVSRGRGAGDGPGQGSGADDGEGFVSRLGGDEFTILLANIRGHEEAAIVTRRILKALSQPLDLEGFEIEMSASVGIAIFPGDGSDLDELLAHADLAMYHAKERGKNNYQFFDEALNDAAQRRAAIVGELRAAVERGELALAYQPVFEARSGSFVAVEALLRWRHPERGWLLPEAFMELAEESGLIGPIGDWALREACRQWGAWRREGLPGPRVAINVSGVQLKDRSLVATLDATLAEFGVPPKALELEITENAMMEDEDEASRSLEALKAQGVSIALDDFGTGYSSLSYVKRFPVDAIKIDRSFVREVGEDAEARAITSAIVVLAHELGLRVVAEGVETEEQERFLGTLHCDELQGFRFCEPLDAEAMSRFLSERGVVSV